MEFFFYPLLFIDFRQPSPPPPAPRPDTAHLTPRPVFAARSASPVAGPSSLLRTPAPARSVLGSPVQILTPRRRVAESRIDLFGSSNSAVLGRDGRLLSVDEIAELHNLQVSFVSFISASAFLTCSYVDIYPIPYTTSNRCRCSRSFCFIESVPNGPTCREPSAVCAGLGCSYRAHSRTGMSLFLLFTYIFPYMILIARPSSSKGYRRIWSS